jgi:hypothetical protein
MKLRATVGRRLGTNIPHIGEGIVRFGLWTIRVPRNAWPLAALVLGLPLWWVLGLSELAPLALAVPMAAQLLRRRTIHLPGGFGWWLLFLGWVLLGLALLWVDAPSAVPGGGSGRLMVFAFRLAWYVACTIVLLWVANLDRIAVPDRTVHVLVACLFVIATAGGLLGILAPELEFRSAIEYVLPGSIRSNGFVAAIVHPETADIQEVLGDPSPRPKAPFPYTNTWGSCMALTLVFLVAAVWRSPKLRLPALGIVGVATVPIAFSLNRGLWMAIALTAVGGLLLLVLRSSPTKAATALVLAALAAMVIWVSPLGDLARERVENQHSNDRRGALLTETVSSVSQGSPLVGFGSTRDVQGSFESIAGGATPDCPACGVPPLGTQGHLWLVLFSQGWLGLAFFLIFVVLALIRSVRCRTINEIVCMFVTGIFLIQLPIYDTLGLPLMIVMIAIGLVARERIGPRTATVSALTRDLRRGAPTVAALSVAGAVAGTALVAGTAGSAYAAEVSVAVTPAPVYLDTGESEDKSIRRRADDITLDTEVALLLSRSALARVGAETGIDQSDIRPMIGVSAVANTHVLEIEVLASSAGDADRVANSLAESYLEERRQYLDQRRDHLLVRLGNELRALPGFDASARVARRDLSNSITRLRFTRPEIGGVVRREPAVPKPPALVVGTAGGFGVGLLVGLVVINLSRDGTGRPRLRRRKA